jgi:hypothetical protein
MKFWPHKAEEDVPVEDPKTLPMKTYTVPGDSAATGTVHLTDKPADPPPDLSTKPDDIVGYCFGYVCPKKHVNDVFTSITVDGFKERRVCQKCGSLARPAIIRGISVAYWGVVNRLFPLWGWAHRSNADTLFNRTEFFSYLDTPKRRKK